MHNSLRRRIHAHLANGGSTLYPLDADTLLHLALAALGGPVEDRRPQHIMDPAPADCIPPADVIATHDHPLNAPHPADVLYDSQTMGVVEGKILARELLRDVDPGDEHSATHEGGVS